MTGVSLYEQSKDKKYQAHLTASQSAFSPVTNTVSCTGISCHISSANAVVATVKAAAAICNRISKQIFFSGPVTGTIAGLTITTTNINYDISKGILSTSHQARYSHAPGFITASQSTVSIKDQSIDLSGGVYSELGA